MEYIYKTYDGEIKIVVTQYWYDVLIAEDALMKNGSRKENRHRGYSKYAKHYDYLDNGEPTLDEVRNKDIFRKDEVCKEELDSHERICKWIETTLQKKPEWVDAFIEIRMNGKKIREYAKEHGVSENSISQKLRRAANKLKNEDLKHKTCPIDRDIIERWKKTAVK